MQNALQVLEKFLSTHAHFFCSSPCSGSPRLRTNKSLEGPAHIVCEHCWALGFWAVPLQYFVCSILCLATTERNAKTNFQTSISVHSVWTPLLTRILSWLSSVTSMMPAVRQDTAASQGHWLAKKQLYLLLD